MGTKLKVPKTLAQCADLLYTTRQKRLELQKEVDHLADEEALLKEHLIQNLPKSEASGVQGKVARATIVVKTIPQVQDWDQFWKGFDKKKDVDLIRRQLNPAAVQERWDHGKSVAGVVPFQAVTVSLNKV